MRLACRVCLALGIDDPEAWLDRAPQRVVAIWRAFYRLEPWGNDYQRHAVEASLLSRINATIGASFGAKLKPLSFADLMPQEWDRTEAIEVNEASIEVDDASIKQAQAAMAAKWGKKNGN